MGAYMLWFLVSCVSAASLSLIVPQSNLIPNPGTLPISTSATLTDIGQVHTAILQKDNRFVFRNISTGSYLLDVHCRDFLFAPLRVDVGDSDNVEVWQTFRGHEWENKGEKLVERPVEVRVLAGKDHYEHRSGCKWLQKPCSYSVQHRRETSSQLVCLIVSILSLLKNPMILLAVVGLGLVFGMPYLIDSSKFGYLLNRRIRVLTVYSGSGDAC